MSNVRSARMVATVVLALGCVGTSGCTDPGAGPGPRIGLDDKIGGSSEDTGQTGSPGEKDVCSSESWRGPDSPVEKAICGVYNAEANATNGQFTFYCACDSTACENDPAEGVPRKSCARKVQIEQNDKAPCPQAMREACGVDPGWNGFCRGAGVGEESVCWPALGGGFDCRCPGSLAVVRTQETDCQKASMVCLSSPLLDAGETAQTTADAGARQPASAGEKDVWRNGQELWIRI